jgi:hypothetical protein
VTRRTGCRVHKGAQAVGWTGTAAGARLCKMCRACANTCAHMHLSARARERASACDNTCRSSGSVSSPSSSCSRSAVGCRLSAGVTLGSRLSAVRADPAQARHYVSARERAIASTRARARDNTCRSTVNTHVEQSQRVLRLRSPLASRRSLHQHPSLDVNT